MKLFSIFLAGILFSAGLMVSGMINPQKVIGFLDIFGEWDPSLAFVMGGAVIVNAIGMRFILRRAKPFFEEGFSLPTRTDMDANLVAGAALFGVGWGLVGFCPGPAIASLGVAPDTTIIFVTAMLAGMYATRFLKIPERRLKPAP